MPATVTAGPTLTAGLRATFDGIYRQEYNGVAEQLGSVMRLGIPSDKLTELYAYYESAPYPELWEKGEHIPVEGLESVGFNVTNYDYGKRVRWNKNDRMDDQIQGLPGRVQETAKNFAWLPSEIFFEFLTGSASLLKAIPNAPDGADLFNATDGSGADRFGVSGGNIVDTTAASGTDPDASEIETSAFSVMARFGQFLNTKGRPIWSPRVHEESYVVYFPLTQLQDVITAFRANIVHSVRSSTGAGVSNVILAAGTNIRLVGTSYLTGSSMYWFRADSTIKALFEQIRQPLEFAEATYGNSDVARDTKEEYVQWDTRRGYGVTVPYMAIQATFS